MIQTNCRREITFIFVKISKIGCLKLLAKIEAPFGQLMIQTSYNHIAAVL